MPLLSQKSGKEQKSIKIYQKKFAVFHKFTLSLHQKILTKD